MDFLIDSKLYEKSMIFVNGPYSFVSIKNSLCEVLIIIFHYYFRGLCSDSINSNYIFIIILCATI